MRIPDYPGPGLYNPASSDGSNNKQINKGLVINDRLTGSIKEAPEIPGTVTRTIPPAASNDRLFMTAVLKRRAHDELREIKSQLLIDLMEKILPAKLRQRWIKMLTHIDFDNSESGNRIERLCRECSAARGNLARLLRHEDSSVEKHMMADTELILLTNGFNNLANRWWLYSSMPD